MVNFSSTDTFFELRLLFGQGLVKLFESFKGSLKRANIRFWIESCDWGVTLALVTGLTGVGYNSPLFAAPERRLIALLVSVRPSMKSLTMKSLLCGVLISLVTSQVNTAQIKLTENVDNEKVAGFGYMGLDCSLAFTILKGCLWEGERSLECCRLSLNAARQSGDRLHQG